MALVQRAVSVMLYANGTGKQVATFNLYCVCVNYLMHIGVQEPAATNAVSFPQENNCTC